MTIPKLTPYSGQVANPDGSQTQTEFTQNMFNQLSYEANLATELDATIDGMNNAVDEVSQNTAIAESSANAAEAAASSAGYKGLWPDTGGNALKGETWQTQVGGVPTGEYFIALQDNTVTPTNDNVNWRTSGTIGKNELPIYTDIAYKSSSTNSPVDNMIAGVPVVANIGDICSTGSTVWQRVSSANGDLRDFTPLNAINIDAFGAKGDGRLLDGSESPSPTNDRVAIQDALKWGAILGNCSVTASSSKSYYWDGQPIIVPSVRNAPDSVTKRPGENLWVIDFAGCEFIGPSYTDPNVVLFESGYFDSNGNVVTNWGLPVEQQITANTRLINFSHRKVHTAIKIYNWVYGCELGNIHGHDVATMVYAKRSFYTNLGQIIHRGAYVAGTPIYRFEDNNNIQPVQGCTSGACDIAYSYSGATEAVALRDCDIAAFDSYGVDIDGPYNLKIDSGYIESNTTGLQPGCVGIKASGGPRVTIDNSWIFGDFPVFDSTSGDGIRLDVRRNNVLSGGARWGFENLPNQSYGDVELPSTGIATNNLIAVYNAKPSLNIDQNVVVFDPDIGFDYILGHVEQTSKFHTIRVNGQTSRGFQDANNAVGYTITQETESGGNQKVRYNTNIVWHDNVLVYVCIKVAHNTGTYEWLGELCKDTFTKKAGASNTSPTYSVDTDSFIVIHTPDLPSAGSVGPSAGEIRII